MKVKWFKDVRLSVTVFDDNLLWVRVEVMEAGKQAKTVHWQRGDPTIPDDLLDLVLCELEAQGQLLVNQVRRRQRMLF